MFSKQMGGFLSVTEDESHYRSSVTALEKTHLLIPLISSCYNYANDSGSGSTVDSWIKCGHCNNKGAHVCVCVRERDNKMCTANVMFIY